MALVYRRYSAWDMFLLHPLIPCKDFHLAKRHYDLALETNSEAYLPVILSLGKLYLRSFWHTLMGGKGGVNIWSPSDNEHRGCHVFLHSD